MKILALEEDVAGIEGNAFTEELLREEAARAWELQQAGILREMYFRADREAAILVLECPTLEEATAMLETLPLVQRKLIAFELIPLIAYPGFARLFRP